MRFMVVVLLIVVLVGCAAPAAPTPTPTPAPVLLTSIDAFVGLWQQTSGVKGFMQVAADGEVRLSEVRDKVAQNPSVIGTVRFDGDQSAWTDNAFPTEGVYAIEVLEGGAASPTKIKIRRVKDSASERAEDLATNWVRVE